MAAKHYINRFVYVYIDHENIGQGINFNAFVTPLENFVPFPSRETPHQYTLTRNDVRYNMKCQVQITQNLAIRIAGTMYESEFQIVPAINRRRRVLGR